MVTAMAQPQAQRYGKTAEEWSALLPREADLPSEVYPMENSLHAAQVRLLVTILEAYWADRHDYFIGDNLTVYFSYEQTKKHDFRGPDFFVVTDTDPRHRNSWVIWEENKFPDLIIELLSETTVDNDRGVKKDEYERRFRTPEYFWYSPETGEFAGFRLRGERYEEIPLDERGWRWSEVLNLYLGAHEGFLRYFTPRGELLPTPLMEAQQQARRADSEKQRADKLAARLRELGLDPDQL